MNELRKLPLWRSCLDQMLQDGLEYGKSYPAEFFEQHLSLDRNRSQFDFAITHIRQALVHKGFWLSSQGQNGAQYVLLLPEENQHVIINHNQQARRLLKRALTLGLSTPPDKLSETQRAALEETTRKTATRLLLLNRSEQAMKILQRHKPKLLEP